MDIMYYIIYNNSLIIILEGFQNEKLQSFSMINYYKTGGKVFSFLETQYQYH